MVGGLHVPTNLNLGNSEFQEPTENLRPLLCWSSSPCFMPPSLLQVRSKTMQIMIRLNVVNECRSNILAPLSFSLPSIQFEKKATIIYILSFPRPFVRLGKVCQVWIWLHYCFLWLFRQWKVSKKLVYCRLVLSQCLTKLVGSSYLYTLIWFQKLRDFNSHSSPFSSIWWSDVQWKAISILRLKDWYWTCIMTYCGGVESTDEFFSFSGLSLLLRSNRLHSLSLQG